MIEPLALIIEARAWIGVPFQHQGRSRLGVDCGGFIVEILRRAGALPTDYVEPLDYGRAPSPQLGELVDSYCERVTRAESATLILIRWPFHREPSHVALCTGPTLIHCYSKDHGVVEQGYRAQWLTRTERIYRLPGIRYP